MGLYLLPIGILIAVVWLLGFVLSKRYGRHLAAQAMAGVIGLSVVAAFVTFQVLIKDVNVDDINPAEPWQKITGLEKQMTELQYRSGLGLFAMTIDNEVQVAGAVPSCLPDGEIAYRQVGQAKVTSSPHIDLPPPPGPVKQQISFDITYPVEYDAGAASSFAVYENGEVWCTERYYQAGPTAGVVLAVAAFGGLYFAVIAFLGVFVTLFILVVVALEIYRRRQEVRIEETRTTPNNVR